MTPATSFVSKPSSCAMPVVLVHDVVAGAQVGEALQRAARRARSRAAARLRKTCVSGQQREPELAPDEPAARRRRRRTRDPSGARRPARASSRRDAAQQRLLAQRLAAVRERDDDVELLAQQPAELVLGLGEPARRERRPLRVERERLALRQRRRARSRRRATTGVEALLLPDRAHLVGLPDEVGRAVERRHEVVGRRGRDAPRPRRGRGRSRRARAAARPPDRSSPRRPGAARAA